ncbi:hypothetical protein KI387_034285, partial [Taxus chinensis]
VEQGKLVYAYVIKYGLESDLFVASAFLDMDAKCGSIEYARRVFDKVKLRDRVLWNLMIAGYVQSSNEEVALQLFYEMQCGGLKPTQSSYASVIKACANLEALGD